MAHSTQPSSWHQCNKTDYSSAEEWLQYRLTPQTLEEQFSLISKIRKNGVLQYCRSLTHCLSLSDNIWTTLNNTNVAEIFLRGGGGCSHSPFQVGVLTPLPGIILSVCVRELHIPVDFDAYCLYSKILSLQTELNCFVF